MRRYTGKVQWLAVKEEAMEMRKQGYSYTMVHEHFMAEGKISMSYKTFYEYARVAHKESLVLPAQKKTGTPPRKLGVSKSDSLIKHDANPDLNDYV